MYNRDWRKEEDYNCTDYHSRDLWAWEFLRRNPEYIKEWNKLVSESPTFDFSNDTTDPETIHAKGAKSRWRLFAEFYINPNCDNPYQPPYMHDVPLFGLYGYFYDNEYLNIIPALSKTQRIIIIDLALPLQQQMEHYKKLLENEQNIGRAYEDLQIINVKNHLPLWKLYLRIIDATNKGADQEDIAEILFDTKKVYGGFDVGKKITDTLNQANRLVNGRYLDILIEPSKMKTRKIKSSK